MSDTDTHKSHLDRLKEAAYEQAQERWAEQRRVEEIVLGKNSRDRVTEIVGLGEDYVVEVTARSGAITWTTVVNGEKTSFHHERQEDAVLHLIGRRYDPNPNTNLSAAYYAGRVLGVDAPPRA